MRDEVELAAAAGFVEPRVQEEFTGLRLDWLTVRCRMRSSPVGVTERLRGLSNRPRDSGSGVVLKVVIGPDFI